MDIARDSRMWGCTPGLPDDAFEHDGLITKRPLRAMAMAYLRPMPGELLWDVGTGAGSIAIEWARTAPGAEAIGFERNAARAERARRNAALLGVEERVRIVDGDAGPLLAAQPAPAAVFIGGGARDAVLETCWSALCPGGRLVMHGVTAETEQLCVAQHKLLGGSLLRVAVETAEPIGGYLGWTPARTVVMWSAVKEAVPTG